MSLSLFSASSPVYAMPPLALRDANVPAPTPTSSRKDGRRGATSTGALTPPPTPANPLVVQRCVAFLHKLQAQYDVSRGESSRSAHPHLPELAPHLAALASPAVPLQHVATAYEVVGNWLHACDKYGQAADILRNAATVYDACSSNGKALLARINVGRALNAAVGAQKQPTGQTEQQRQTRVDEADQYWLAVEDELRGRELRLESYACYHHGSLHAQRSAQCAPTDVEQAMRLFQRAMEVWSRLSHIPSQYAPTARAVHSEPMAKHRQHVLQAAEAVQTAAQRCALYGRRQQQIAQLQWVAECLSSAMLHLPAAVHLKHCAVLSAVERDCSAARRYSAQAEASRAQPASVATATIGRDKLSVYELRYAILHFQLSVLLHPPSSSPPRPPTPLVAFLAQPLPSLPFQQQMLRAQLLSAISLVEERRGRVGESEARCRDEYKLWSSCLRRMCASHLASQPASSSLSAAELSTLVAEQDALGHEQYTVLWSYVDCLYRYARLLERQGQPLLCIAHLHKASAVCEALDERRQRRRLDRLWWRVRVKLAWQMERAEGAAASHQVLSKDKWEMAACEAVQSLEAAEEEAQRSGADQWAEAELSAELADLYMRRGRLHSAGERYRHAVSVAAQLVDAQPTRSAVPEPAVIKRQARATTRAKQSAQLQQSAEQQHGEADPATARIARQQATWQAKLASIQLSSFAAPNRAVSTSSLAVSSIDEAVASLVRSSATLTLQQQQVELAWSAYWQAVAERIAAPATCSAARSVWSFPSSAPHTRPSTIASAPLHAACTTASSSLLYSAVNSSFSRSPPYVSRLLFSSLSACLGLSSPLDAIFALNASLGIATRHSTNRTLRQRSIATPGANKLSEQLSALRLEDDGEERVCAGESTDGAEESSVFTLDGGVERDRERFEQEFVHRLPLAWTVVTLALSDSRRHLLVSRLQAPHHNRAPVLLRLPLGLGEHAAELPPSMAALPTTSTAAPPTRATRGKSKAASTTKATPSSASAAASASATSLPATTAAGALPSDYQSVLGELCGVLDESGRVNSSSLRSQHTCTYDERKEWWEERERLDERMGRLLQRMEDGWFGAWKGVLCGDDKDETRQRLLHDAVLRVTRCMQQLLGGSPDVNASAPLAAYLRVLLRSPTSLTPSQLHSAVAYLLGWTDCAQQSEAALHAMQLARSTADWQQLATVCATIEAERHQLHTGPVAPRSRSPVILLLSSQLQRLPFESMPVLEGQPVTRMPSWLQLLPHLPPRSSALHSGVCTSLSLSSSSYILNPSGDSPRTQSTFAPLLPALGLTRGLTGSPPSASAFLDALSADLFLYVGHGSGDQYVQSQHIAASAPGRVRGACLLMGCSSARGRGESVEYEGCEGMVGALLQAGARSVVGNLWDVTDVECDRFAVRLLEQVTRKQTGSGSEEPDESKREVKAAKRGRSGKRAAKQPSEASAVDNAMPDTICELVASSRSACRLRYLMGASPVVYGIPTAFSHTV